MKHTLKIFLVLGAVMVISLLVPFNFSWAQCPEDPIDLRLCDTLHVVPWPETDTCFAGNCANYKINNPGQKFPCFLYVNLLVTHDSNTFWWAGGNKWVQDSISAMVVPLGWTRTNPAKYCSLSTYWNENTVVDDPEEPGYPFPRRMWRKFPPLGSDSINFMDKLKWNTMVVDMSSDSVLYSGVMVPPHVFMSLIAGATKKKWFQEKDTLLATLTFRIEDTMHICIDTTFYPPSSNLSFIRYDSPSYVPRNKMPLCIWVGPARIEVTSPNGGEIWLVGETHDITWISEKFTDPVKIELSRNGGSTWATLVPSTTNDGSWTWSTVTGPASTTCRVRVSDAADGVPIDISDEDFTIYSRGHANEDGVIVLAKVIRVRQDQRTIQDGLDSAQQGDTVLVEPGTYYENIVWPETNGIKLLSEAGAENTTINGYSYSVITFPGLGGIDTTTVVRGFRITNGRTSYGGGIFCHDSSPTLTNCIISGNSAGPGGGGIYCDSHSNPTLRNCAISENSSVQYGGGIFCHYSSPTLTNCIISGNSVEDGGGGIYCTFNSSATFTNCTISGNSAEVEAGGIWCNTSDLTFTNCTISGNSAVSLAGGIYCERQSTDTTLNPTFTNCTISGNSTEGDGGGILCDFSSKPSIKHCTITDNRASDTADGIYIIHGAWPTLDSNNICYNGYGVFKDTPPLLMADSQWWGHASGPFHPDSNPGGQGDSVSDFVDFLPYLTEADTIAPPIPPVGLDTVVVGNDSIRLIWHASPIGDLAGYKVYFKSHSSGFPYSDTINVGLDTSLTLNGLTKDTTYYIAVTCYDNSGNESWYSTEIHATAGGCIRGDANCDGVINVSDVVYLINYLFTGGPAPNPLWLGDANCDETVSVSDVVYLINYLFISGPPPGC